MAGERGRRSVAVIGAGAVGGYYGARLAQAGHDVRFLMRRDLEAVRAGGLRIHSTLGDFHLEHPFVARRSEEIGPVEWVICALKATSLDAVPSLVGPCVGEGTRILVLMNGLGLEERFAEWFGAERIFGGLAFTCLNRGEPGTVNHLDYGSITLGHLLDDAAQLAEAEALWRDAEVEIDTSPSLLRARWEKLCWNVPFNGLCVTCGGVPTDRILADPELRRAVREVIDEVVEAGNADLASRGERARLGPAVADDMIARTDAMAGYRPSTMIDFVEGRAMEVDAIFAEPLRRARALGVDTPRLALLTAQMRALDARRGGE